MEKTAWNEAIVHLRYCRLIAHADPFVVTFAGVDYRVGFQDERFSSEKAYLITRIDGGTVEMRFLLWMSVYTGEDAIGSGEKIDSRFVWYRGDFDIKQVSLQRFLIAAERSQSRKWPRRKRELFDGALIYFSAAIRTGVNMMPTNLGLFALSLECLGNVKYGKRDAHYTFGNRQFLQYLTKRLAPLKRDEKTRAAVKDIQKRLQADIDLLNHLRNDFYGHSLLHLTKDRKELVRLLREWYRRNGATSTFANLSFQSERIRGDVQREAPALYKRGLRLNRLFIFLAIGLHAKIPFGTHDWRVLGDLRDEEQWEYGGGRITFRSGLVEPGHTAPIESEPHD
jgi:hypothetical protein